MHAKLIPTGADLTSPNRVLHAPTIDKVATVSETLLAALWGFSRDMRSSARAGLRL